MGDRSDDRLPQELAEVGELLRESRTQPSALELDEIKLHAKARARKRQGSPMQLRRGVNVRSRSVTLVLTLLMLGGTTAAGIAGGGGGGNDDGAANAQYRPPKCSKDMRECECPKGYSLTVQNGQIVCSKNPGDGGHGGGGDDGHGDHGGHGGHGHHHHGHWRQGGNGHWQCSDDGHHWRDWNGREDDW
jgi:hypothetical protein